MPFSRPGEHSPAFVLSLGHRGMFLERLLCKCGREGMPEAKICRCANRACHGAGISDGTSPVELLNCWLPKSSCSAGVESGRRPSGPEGLDNLGPRGAGCTGGLRRGPCLTIPIVLMMLMCAVLARTPREPSQSAFGMLLMHFAYCRPPTLNNNHAISSGKPFRSYHER